jgi:hypothetical protein
MFSKQFLNVQEHFLKCSANIFKSAKKSEHFGIYSEHYDLFLNKFWICFIEQFWMFDKLFSKYFGILFGTLWIVLEQIWNSFLK